MYIKIGNYVELSKEPNIIAGIYNGISSICVLYIICYELKRVCILCVIEL